MLCLVTQSCPTLCDPKDCSPPGSSAHGDSPGKNWIGFPCPPPGDLPHPGIEPRPPALQASLERYALSPERAAQFVLCDVVGQAGGGGHAWQAQGFRVFGDNEKPLLIQELWKPREGLSRRFELRKRSEVEELAAKMCHF